MYADPEKKKAFNESYRARKNELTRQSRYQLKLDTLAVYGTSCAVCGFDDVRALQIDHINNDGNVERKALGGQNISGWRFYDHLRKAGWPQGYQTLCANHNMIKHIEYNDSVAQSG